MKVTCFYVKFVYSEKATKISTLPKIWQTKVDISQKFVAFSEYMNFNQSDCFDEKGKTHKIIKSFSLFNKI